MTTINRYNQAFLFASKAHRKQYRKGTGTLYFVHPFRVSLAVDTLRAKTIALLHDTVEDTDTTIDTIRAVFGDSIADGVALLTHDKQIPYIDYVSYIAQSKDEDVIRVKIADINDNLTDFPSEKLIKKAAEALPILNATLL